MQVQGKACDVELVLDEVGATLFRSVTFAQQRKALQERQELQRGSPLEQTTHMFAVLLKGLGVSAGMLNSRKDG